MLKKQNGITLVALIITIIVMLILAGVSISLVLGDNGVLTQAQNANEANVKGGLIDAIGMANTEFATNYWANTNGSRAKSLDTDQIDDAVTANFKSYDGQYTVSYDGDAEGDLTTTYEDASIKITPQAGAVVNKTIEVAIEIRKNANGYLEFRVK